MLFLVGVVCVYVVSFFSVFTSMSVCFYVLVACCCLKLCGLCGWRLLLVVVCCVLLVVECLLFVLACVVCCCVLFLLFAVIDVVVRRCWRCCYLV